MQQDISAGNKCFKDINKVPLQVPYFFLKNFVVTIDVATDL